MISFCPLLTLANFFVAKTSHPIKFLLNLFPIETFKKEPSISTILRTRFFFVFFPQSNRSFIHSIFFYGTISGYVVTSLSLSSFPIINNRQYSFSEKWNHERTHVHERPDEMMNEWMVRPRRRKKNEREKGKERRQTQKSPTFFSHSPKKIFFQNSFVVTTTSTTTETFMNEFFLLQTFLAIHD